VRGGEGLGWSAPAPEVRRGDDAGGSSREVAPKAWGGEETALARGRKGGRLCCVARGPGNGGSGVGCGSK
jgi:hypothetical protein